MSHARKFIPYILNTSNKYVKYIQYIYIFNFYTFNNFLIIAQVSTSPLFIKKLHVCTCTNNNINIKRGDLHIRLQAAAVGCNNNNNNNNNNMILVIFFFS
jgi:hypothetical protein